MLSIDDCCIDGGCTVISRKRRVEKNAHCVCHLLEIEIKYACLLCFKRFFWHDFLRDTCCYDADTSTKRSRQLSSQFPNTIRSLKSPVHRSFPWTFLFLHQRNPTQANAITPPPIKPTCKTLARDPASSFALSRARSLIARRFSPSREGCE